MLGRWPMLLSTGFQTILPPNAPSCTSEKGPYEGVLSVSSHHRGGVHVSVCGWAGDVCTRFDRCWRFKAAQRWPMGPISIEALQVPVRPVPYGIWGAMGTRASKERSLIKDAYAAASQVFYQGNAKKSFTSAMPLEDWDGCQVDVAAFVPARSQLRKDGFCRSTH